MNRRDEEVVQWLILDDSEGYLVLWQAPQQIPYFVQTLRYVVVGRAEAAIKLIRLRTLGSSEPFR